VSLFSGLKGRLREGLRRSQEFLAAGLAEVFESDRPIEEGLWEELEELLISADLGAGLAADFTNRAREEVMFGTVTRAAELRPLFRRFLLEALVPAATRRDWQVMMALLAIGGLLIVGLFSRTAALGAAVMLAMFYLSMPPWPGLPENPRAEGHYLYVNKNLIEMIAALALATLPSGRWLGVDALIRGLVTRRLSYWLTGEAEDAPARVPEKQ